MANPTIRDEFKNKSGGWIGVITIDARGERRGIAVPPGDTVWLTEEEQIATANAPRSDTDNPLTNGDLVLVTEAAEVRNRRALRPEGEVVSKEDAARAAAAEQERQLAATAETGATPPPAGEAEEGAFAPGEEVATPAAAEAPKPARRRAPAAAG